MIHIMMRYKGRRLCIGLKTSEYHSRSRRRIIREKCEKKLAEISSKSKRSTKSTKSTKSKRSTKSTRVKKVRKSRVRKPKLVKGGFSKRKNRKQSAKVKRRVIKIHQLDIKRSTGWISKAKGRKENWAHIGDGYLYLSYPKGRAYWLLWNMIKHNVELPHITANDKTRTVSVNTFKMRFKRPTDYNWAKACLLKYSKK